MLQAIIKRTLRVPTLSSRQGDGEGATRQLDVTLMNVGFKLSEDLFRYLSMQHPANVIEIGQVVLSAVKELVGEHVQHNVYFIDFPANVPDTTTFWITELLRFFLKEEIHYGHYQHSYEDMLASHDEFIALNQDRIRLLRLGKSLSEEKLNLYHLLAKSTIPLNEADRELVKVLAEQCLTETQPDSIPMRETKALINSIRIKHQLSIQVDTITDILRLACALSAGDVTLQEATRFCSLSKSMRRTLLEELDRILAHAPGQLADIHQYSERWKRLGEYVHPHSYPHYPCAQDVFAVARGEKNIPTFESTLEQIFANQDMPAAMKLLSTKPGVFVRNIDRLLRNTSPHERELLLENLQKIVSNVSGRVLLSLREHLQNRTVKRASRVFINRNGGAWVTSDDFVPFDENTVQLFTTLLDQELLRRLPHTQYLVVDPEIRTVALPLSSKNQGNGFAILPRGSSMPVEAEILRFFIYWKQKYKQTDYDLSAIILDDNYTYVEHLSYTNLQALGGVHSGDLTDATDGASEFIDIDLSKVRGKYIIPTVNIYRGEDFTKVEECFFGLMARTYEQKGMPFEAATVRIKSDIRGNGRVSLPLAFIRGENASWSAKWLHLYLKGDPNYNRVEENHLSAILLTQAMIDRSYLTFDYLLNLLKQKSDTFSWLVHDDEMSSADTFIGLQAPNQNTEHTTVYCLQNLHELIPT